MKILSCKVCLHALLAWSLLTFVASAAEVPGSPAPARDANAPAPAAPGSSDARNFLFTSTLTNFSEADYARAVGPLISEFEKKTKRQLKPTDKHRVGLKIYTSSGPGIATPKNLVRTVIRELVNRGFTRENIFLVDLQEKRLRESGYLPGLRAGNESFEGCPVLALDTEKYYRRQWCYENQLPSKELFARQGDYAATLELMNTDKLSFLPVPLFLEMDFWINLPVVMDSPALGVSGALGNATIWNVSNQRRFLDNPGNAQKAAVEIASIPEIQRTLVFHLMSLERYQYAGGPAFDANFCMSEKALWLSANPLILDYLMLQRINIGRTRQGFPAIEPEPVMFLQGNTSPIFLGSCRPSDLNLVRVPPTSGAFRSK
ncbi:MAG: hypothetical protein LBV54_02470 [Puniceicoccales bacterium]|jgi:hypothetical protein|nr:hypothetical protein [Puniceicoccales bacterium]